MINERVSITCDHDVCQNYVILPKTDHMQLARERGWTTNGDGEYCPEHINHWQIDTVHVASASDPYVCHRVDMLGAKAVKCDCTGFAYRGNCRHLDEAEAMV